jgi:hypothetical protein
MLWPGLTGVAQQLAEARATSLEPASSTTDEVVAAVKTLEELRTRPEGVAEVTKKVKSPLLGVSV